MIIANASRQENRAASGRIPPLPSAVRGKEPMARDHFPFRSDPALTGPPVLRATAIALSFGATRALRQVDISLMRGEVHALVGGNGAGKTTLVRILLGALRPASGTLEIEGDPVAFRSVRDAIAKGIFPIYQHLSQFPDLTVRENLAAFNLGMAGGFLARNAMPSDKTMRGWMDEVGLAVPLATPCRDLSTGERQLLEIARAIAQEAKVLVLDEPTAALTHADSETLLQTIDRLRARGTAILFISHKLDEVAAIADRVTVIRDGACTIAGAPMAGLSTGDIVMAMVGRDVAPITDIAPHRSEIAAQIRGLTVRRRAAPVDIDVARGEIVGLGGIVGSGADRIAESIAGATEPPAGTVWVDGRRIKAGCRRDAVAKGVGFVPTDRLADGIFSILDVLQNTSAANPGLLARWKLRPAEADAQARRMLERIGLVPFRLDLEARDFSGGNQQKLVVARNLLIDGLKLLVLCEPTRGVDVAARRAIHEAVLEAAGAGVAVIVASSDIDELLGLCHRVLIVRDHTVTGAFARGAKRERVIDALAGETA